MAVKAYLVSLPVEPINTYAFKFTCSIGGVGWSFQFNFINNRWTVYATPPNLAMREATVYSGTLGWKGFPDYRYYFVSTKLVPGLNDLSSIAMYILDVRT
jgi:hypothetical protein